MMYDLALSIHGDLVFGANSDLAGVSGVDLLEQRMRLRLKLYRGTWVYDDAKTLGSQLYRLMGMSASDAHAALDAYVREALREMPEITIDEVFHIHEHEGETHTETSSDPDHTDIHTSPSISLTVGVLYSINSEEGDEGEQIENRELTVNVPIGGGGF